MTFDAHHLPARARTDAVNQATTDVVAGFIEPMRGTASFVLYRSAARHFLYWLNRRRIPITDADTAIVRRFAEHRCCCPYYSAKQVRDPVYISRVGRFVRFLEDRGNIRVVEDVEDIPRYLSVYFIIRLLNISQPGFASRDFNGAMSTTPSLNALSVTIATARSGANVPSQRVRGRRHVCAAHDGFSPS